jgi:hypothetical protein
MRAWLFRNILAGIDFSLIAMGQRMFEKMSRWSPHASG